MALFLSDYECTECGYVFEYLADSSDCGTTECPECHMPAIRVIGRPSHGKHASWSQWRALDNDRS
jgi:putative FmdB family regulatory protein